MLPMIPRSSGLRRRFLVFIVAIAGVSLTAPGLQAQDKDGGKAKDAARIRTDTAKGKEEGKAKEGGGVSKKLTVERFFEKVIEARGGREAFEAVQNRSYGGTLEIKGPGGINSGAIELYEAAGDKRYQIVHIGTTPTERGSDGTTAWEIVQSKARILSGEEKDIAERMNKFNDVLYWSELYPDTKILAKETVDGRSCYKVVQKPAAGPERTMYFDRQTGLLARVDTVRQTPQGNIPVIIRYEDYREVDGVKFAFKVVQRLQVGDQEQTITTTWSTIKQNTDLGEEQFNLPEKVKAVAGAAPAGGAGGEGAKESK